MRINKLERVQSGQTAGKCPRLQLIVTVQLQRPQRVSPEFAVARTNKRLRDPTFTPRKKVHPFTFLDENDVSQIEDVQEEEVLMPDVSQIEDVEEEDNTQPMPDFV